MTKLGGGVHKLESNFLPILTTEVHQQRLLRVKGRENENRGDAVTVCTQKVKCCFYEAQLTLRMVTMRFLGPITLPFNIK